MKMIARLFILLVWLSATLAINITLEECSPAPVNNSVTVVYAEVVECQSEPCVIVKTRTYNVRSMVMLNFHMNETNKFDIAVEIMSPFGIIRPFTTDVCQYLKPGLCSKIVPGTVTVQEMTEQCPAVVPAYKGVVRFLGLLDGVTVYCGQVNITVEEPPATYQEAFDKASGFGVITGGLGG